MSETLVETLYSAAVYTFEQVVFLLPDVPPDEIQRRRPVAAVATIAFSGPPHGVFQLHAAEGLLPRLTANMMGTDTANEALQLDALGEIANIICGQVLPAIDPASAFQQKPPEVVTCSLSELPAGAVPAARVELGLDSSRAELMLFLYSDSSPRSAL